MPLPSWPRLATPLVALVLAGPAALTAAAQPAASPATGAPTAASAAAAAPAAPQPRSALDAPLFYQLLIGEMELRAGQPGAAYQIILDAARRTRDELLFRRAVDIALQARAGDDALRAAAAWSAARPESMDALRYQLQILAALGRVDDVAAPLRALIDLTPEGERGPLIASLPRFLQRAPDAAKSARLLESLLAPYLGGPATGVPARVAIARGWLAAKDRDRALALVEEAHRLDRSAPGPILVALELLPSPAAEQVITSHLEQPGSEPAMRLAYVRALTQAQRYADAVRQLEIVTRAQPELAPPFLTLGALQLELKHPREGEAALLRYVELAERPNAAAGAASEPAPRAAGSATDDDEATVDDGERQAQGLVQAWLLLAQAAEARGDFSAAEGWLARIDDPERALEVTARRASLMARQGRLADARALIRAAPERGADDGRTKLLAEAGLLRDLKQWGPAFDVLAEAVARSPDDADLLYEQAMMAEKLDRLDEMERLLRRVIELKPDNAHAHNALGYSWADRRMRLPEARQLILRALELSPGDPFITDSLGWVEYRLGNLAEARRLLAQAYATRPDAEIGAHLGEVLWAAGERDEARRIWREVKARDAANDVLRETLARLRVDL